jgi:DNA/RNA-binding domain of Phe-tRNA-synthetase-like protein
MQLVITDAAGEIVWVVNERPSAHSCVTESTKEILVIEWKE